MRTIAVVTTCHRQGYEQYGRRMVETFDRYWPKDITLYLYAEGFQPDIRSDRIVTIDLLDACPGLVAFKHRHRNNPRAHGREARGFRLTLRKRHRNSGWFRYKLKLARMTWGLGYRWDAVRFSHKSFAVFDARRRCGTNVLCWLDSDVVVFDHVPRPYLEQLMPPDCLLSYLKRPSFSECGFLAYNLMHAHIDDFFAEFEQFYTTDSLFREQEYHDSWLFDVVRKRFEKRQHCRMFDIAEGVGTKVGHVFINSSLGRYMDHLKGDRTADGASSPADLLAARPEPYWRRVTLSSRSALPADAPRPARPADAPVWASPRPGTHG
jgi:hypothetical protein